MALMFLSMEHLHVHVHAGHAEPDRSGNHPQKLKAICISAIRMFCFAASLPLPHKLKDNILDEVIHDFPAQVVGPRASIVGGTLLSLRYASQCIWYPF